MNITIRGVSWKIIVAPDDLANADWEAEVDVDQRVIWLSRELSPDRQVKVTAEAVCLAWREFRRRKPKPKPAA